MEFHLFVCLSWIVAVMGYTSIDEVRERRSVSPGQSSFHDWSAEKIKTFQMTNPRTGMCVMTDSSGQLHAAICDAKDDSQMFMFVVGSKLHEGALKSVKYDKCLQPRYGNTGFVSCSYMSRYRDMIWGCYFPKSQADKDWIDNDSGGLKPVTTNQCLTFDLERKVKLTLQVCSELKGNDGQKIHVLGNTRMAPCSKAGALSERTRDESYYYLKHQAFRIEWNTKYVRIYMIYSDGVYEAFKRKYGSHSEALTKIRAHAQDTMNIVDKLYRQVNVRILLVGLEVWDQGSKIGKDTNSREIHANVGNYVKGLLRAGKKFTHPIYYFDKTLYGAAGTASHNLCGWNQPFVLATVGGDNRMVPRSLAHILTHEVGHLFHAPHTFDPPHTCPTYHLFGGRCTMGGNDWPKGLSSYELASIRNNKYTCLDGKPSQQDVLGCGNGVLEPGEECDCGSSSYCQKSHPCCDGQICKLKKNAQCSDESCCSSCKVDLSKNGCEGETTTLTASHGEIYYPHVNHYNIRKSWKIKVSAGTKIMLVMHMPLFDFHEDCPYDYLEVRDGGSMNSRLLGRFCRTPQQFWLLSSGNEMFITLKTDANYESKFKLYYSEYKGELPSGSNKHNLISESQCAKVSYASLKSSSIYMSSTQCDEFMMTSDFHLKHVATGLCAEPSKWYGHYNDWAKLSLNGNCANPGSVFIPIGDYILHAASGKYLYANHGSQLMISKTAKKRFKLESTVVSTRPPSGNQYAIIHTRSNFCWHVNSNKEVVLSKSCSTMFEYTSSQRIVHSATGKCITAAGTGNGAKIELSSFCAVESAVWKKSSGSLMNPSTNKCIHPISGGWYPKDGESLVLYAGCGSVRMAFEFSLRATLPPTTLPPPPGYVVRHSGGLCLDIDKDKYLVLTKGCQRRFEIDAQGYLVDLQSKGCAKPIFPNNNNSKVRVATTNCRDSMSKYTKITQGSLSFIKHASGKCFHPLNGSATPAVDTPIVIYSGCSGSRLSFKWQK